MNNSQIKEIIEHSSCLELNNLEDKYNKSYQCFCEFFTSKNIITEQDLIIGANFTYGWMPTILNFKSSEFETCITILNKAKLSTRISTSELTTLKGLINNSLVGTSKLLHFINPEVYAIWDSRICHFLTGKSYKSKVEQVELFWSYLDLCDTLVLEKEFKAIHEKYKQKIGFNVSPLRTAEQIMFISSKQPIA